MTDPWDCYIYLHACIGKYTVRPMDPSWVKGTFRLAKTKPPQLKLDTPPKTNLVFRGVAFFRHITQATKQLIFSLLYLEFGRIIQNPKKEKLPTMFLFYRCTVLLKIAIKSSFLNLAN